MWREEDTRKPNCSLGIFPEIYGMVDKQNNKVK